MDILLLQISEEIEIAQTSLGNIFDQCKIVAWTPFAVDGLKEKGLGFETISDYQQVDHSSENLYSDYKIYQNWCQLLDQHIYIKVPEIRRLGLRPFQNNLLALRKLFSLYFSEINKLNLLIKQNHNCNIYYFEYPSSPTSQVIKSIQRENKWNINFIKMEGIHTFKSLLPEDGVVPYWFLKKKSLYWRFVKFLWFKTKYEGLFEFLSGIARRRLYKQRAVTILVLTANNDTGDYLSNLRKRGLYKFIFWEDLAGVRNIDFQIPAEEIIESFRNDAASHKWTTRHGIDIFEYICPEIKKILKHEVPILFSTAKEFKQLNRKFNFASIISAYPMTQWEAIFDQGIKLDIPVLIFDHGATALLDEPFIYPYCMVQNQSSKLYFLVFSKIIADWCDNEKRELAFHNPQNIPSGSLYYEKLLNKNMYLKNKISQEIKICYVCGGFGIIAQNNDNFNKAGRDDASVYLLRYQVLERLQGKPGIRACFKLGYGTEKFNLLLERRITSGYWENLEHVSSKTKFTSLLDKFDLYVLEAPGTPVFEILTTAKPVVVLIDSKRTAITPTARNLLEKRVTIAESIDEFLSHIEDVAENGRQAKAFTLPDHSDKTFINTYATCGDNKSLELTVDFLESLIKNE